MHLYRCILYAAGLYLTFGFDDLSLQAFASQSPTVPSSSSSSFYLYDASNAVDRNTETCMRTDAIGKGPNAPYKDTWWKVDLGAVYNIYSINILFKNYDYENIEYRQRGRFAGFSLYVSNTGDIEGSTLCYKDGPQLPPLNFTTTCTKYGRFVIFHNERKDGVIYPEGYQLSNIYTELCEVIVKGCKRRGVYGTACDILCPFTCKDNTCNIQTGTCLECEHGLYGSYCNLSCPTNCNDSICQRENGTCFTCKPGWTGKYCDTKCKAEWHGLNCSQHCVGHCRYNIACNHVTGQCDRGCAVGWTGSLCNKECDIGTFGDDCVNNCSGHCLINAPCNKQTGHCDEGCQPGYTDVFCSEICRPGYYGNRCGHLCNGYCMSNEICNHVDGVCVTGCQDGYTGKYCNNSCKIGFFGRNCSSVCSPHCKTCRHTDGHCSCFAGYTGHRCTTECFQSYGENCHYRCSQHCYNKNCDRFNGSCQTGCTDGFYGERCDKDIQMLRQDSSPSFSWIVGLSVSLAVNIILFTSICVMCRGKSGKKGSISGHFLSSWKRSDFYQDTNATIDETSTYQELAVPVPNPELPHQNTILK